jgi:hypothetical protein
MPLRQPLVDRGRKQKSGLPVNRAEIAHQRLIQRKADASILPNPRACAKSDRLLGCRLRPSDCIEPMGATTFTAPVASSISALDAAAWDAGANPPGRSTETQRFSGSQYSGACQLPTPALPISSMKAAASTARRLKGAKKTADPRILALDRLLEPLRQRSV